MPRIVFVDPDDPNAFSEDGDDSETVLLGTIAEYDDEKGIISIRNDLSFLGNFIAIFHEAIHVIIHKTFFFSGMALGLFDFVYDCFDRFLERHIPLDLYT